MAELGRAGGLGGPAWHGTTAGYSLNYLKSVRLESADQAMQRTVQHRTVQESGLGGPRLISQLSEESGKPACLPVCSQFPARSNQFGQPGQNSPMNISDYVSK